MIEIKVPEMGESITEATILSWHKNPGEAVQADEVLAELETDKVTVEVRSPSGGVLTELLKKAEDTVSVHEVIGRIDETAVKPAAQEKEEKSAAPAPQATPAPQNKKNTTIPPAATRIMAEKGASASDITGTGKHGQVTREDAVKYNPPAVKQSSASQAQREEIVPMTRLRKAIAERLLSAQQNAAILTTFNEVDMSAVMALRSRYKDSFKEHHEVGLGFMSFFTKAVISGLREFPAINAEIRDNNIVYKNYYDIGIAVGGPKGLVVPVVRDADMLSFAGIEKEIVRLAGLVRESRIELKDLQGGSFSITNGGIYGSMMSTPILNPPQSGILGMHNITKRAVVVNDEIVVRPMMYIALSYDHRIVDGKEAVQFLVKIKEMIEDPSRLLLEV